MRNQTKCFFGFAMVASLAFVAVGCHSSAGTDSATPTTQDRPVTHMMAMPAQGNATANGKAGSELWAENCTRCHNARPPQYYSDATWDIIVHHMRLRANLTGEEARAVAEFLKAAS